MIRQYHPAKDSKSRQGFCKQIKSLQIYEKKQFQREIMGR